MWESFLSPVPMFQKAKDKLRLGAFTFTRKISQQMCVLIFISSLFPISHV